jgi:hypothetical protein
MLTRTIAALVALIVGSCAAAEPATAPDTPRVISFTGQSHAGRLLKTDTLKLIATHLKEHGCEVVAHIDTKVFAYEPSNGTKDHVWGKEGWMVTACGKPHRFFVTFKEDGAGGTDIQIQTK